MAVSKASEAIEDLIKAVAKIASHASKLIASGDRVMTHSYSSTVMAALKEAFNRYHNIDVIVTRSGTGRTGERIAREASEYGIPITFIDDTAVGLFISKVNKVMVGADRVCADGKIVNGIGTYQMALVAVALSKARQGQIEEVRVCARRIV